MVEGTRFLRLIPESSPESLKPASAMRRIVFCTGTKAERFGGAQCV